jgi:hypothetical protein
MTNCVNETMRDLLPLLAHDALTAGEVAQVRAHVAECSSCAAELDVLVQAHAMFAAATPRVDTAAILARLAPPVALPTAAPSPGARPVLTVSRTPRRILGVPRYALAAAASLVLVATLSLAVLRPVFFDAAPVGVDIALVDSGPAGAPTIPVGILGGSDLADFDADELAALLLELDRMEATIAVEPITMRQPLGPELEGI